MKKIVSFIFSIVLVLSNFNVVYASNIISIKDINYGTVTIHKVDKIVRESNLYGSKLSNDYVSNNLNSFDWTKLSNRYYYTRLNEKKRDLYDKLYNIADNYLNGRLNIIKETWKSGTGEIVTQYIINQKEKNKYTYDTFVEVFQLVCYENPQFFFLSPELVANEDEIALTVYPKFSTREKLSNGIKKVVNKLNWYIMSVGTEVILNVQDEIAEYLARKIYKK